MSTIRRIPGIHSLAMLLALLGATLGCKGREGHDCAEHDCDCSEPEPGAGGEGGAASVSTAPRPRGRVGSRTAAGGARFAAQAEGDTGGTLFPPDRAACRCRRRHRGWSPTTWRFMSVAPIAKERPAAGDEQWGGSAWQLRPR